MVVVMATPPDAPGYGRRPCIPSRPGLNFPHNPRANVLHFTTRLLKLINLHNGKGMASDVIFTCC